MQATVLGKEPQGSGWDNVYINSLAIFFFAYFIECPNDALLMIGLFDSSALSESIEEVHEDALMHCLQSMCRLMCCTFATALNSTIQCSH